MSAKLRRVVKIIVVIAVALFILSGLIRINFYHLLPLREASSERSLTLPEDQGAHFDAKTEWWYYTGHLQTEDDKKYGFELVFFKFYIPFMPFKWLINPVYTAHFAMVDEDTGHFTYATRIDFPRIWEAGADKDHYRVWNGEWEAESIKGAHHLRASMKDYAINLSLYPSKEAVFHGDQGIVDMGKGGKSYYYSYTRMKVNGLLKIKGTVKKVKGTAWMDHQWGSWNWDGFKDWDWFSIQLNNGSELMLFNFLDSRGVVMKESGGTIVYPNGDVKHLKSSDFYVYSLNKWVSPHTRKVYPINWHITIPDYGIDFQVHPVNLDQEIRDIHMGKIYWEGPAKVKGRFGKQSVSGVSYVELTGFKREGSK